MENAIGTRHKVKAHGGSCIFPVAYKWQIIGMLSSAHPTQLQCGKWFKRLRSVLIDTSSAILSLLIVLLCRIEKVTCHPLEK